MRIEKIIISQTNSTPKDSVHSAFFQTYMESEHVFESARKIFGIENLPKKLEEGETLKLLFCYGAGYKGGGIYDWFAGFIIDSPDHGYNFIMTNDLSIADEGVFELQDTLIGIGIGRANLDFIERYETIFRLDQSESNQINQVISAWHELFQLSEDENNDEKISILTTDKRLPAEFRSVGNGCFVSGQQSDWEDTIGLFSEHWSFTARFS